MRLFFSLCDDVGEVGGSYTSREKASEPVFFIEFIIMYRFNKNQEGYVKYCVAFVIELLNQIVY